MERPDAIEQSIDESDSLVASSLLLRKVVGLLLGVGLPLHWSPLKYSMLKRDLR
ncbi:MAG: hypothetical protein GKR96_05745 [Gammaproteobacteria bacterium]|nr:hypothetical protein [Gammaproteobacteria bacterium]